MHFSKPLQLLHSEGKMVVALRSVYSDEPRYNFMFILKTHWTKTRKWNCNDGAYARMRTRRFVTLVHFYVCNWLAVSSPHCSPSDVDGRTLARSLASCAFLRPSPPQEAMTIKMPRCRERERERYTRRDPRCRHGLKQTTAAVRF